MALSVICPGCEADYSVPENLIGKSIRCKKCGETIAVKAAKAARPAARVAVDDEDDDRPRRPATRRRFEEDDEYDAPRKSKSKGVSPVLIGGLLLLLGGGAAAGAYFVFGGNGNDQAKNDPPPAVRPAVTPDAGTTDPKAGEEKKADEKKAEEKKPEETKATLEKKPDEPKVEEKKPEAPITVAKVDTKPGVNPIPGVTNQVGGSSLGLSRDQYFSGLMSPITLDKVKKAAVFIRTDFENGAATGSGWFGIEPGIVFTNAHVLNMLAPNAPKPKKLTFWINSGLPDERMIPHVNIKILAVDRDIDIACLQIINEKDLPTPLKVRPSAECIEGLGLSTVGFPLGYDPARAYGRAKKQPEVSIRPTRITAFRYTDFGILRRLQIEGAIAHGNSGGAVVDAEGSVCCVVVEAMTASEAVGGCVPTEYAIGLLAGRLAELEYGMPYNLNGKVQIPVKANVLDPFNRLKKVGMTAWIGNSSKKHRAPGPSKPKEELGDSHFIDIALTVDPKTKVAVGELELPKLESNTVYWGQPYFENAIFTRYYMPGAVIDTRGPPADRVPTVLAYKPKIDTSRVVKMQNSSAIFLEHAEGEGESKNERILLRVGMTVNETTRAPSQTDTVQAARLQHKFEELEMPKVEIGIAAEFDLMSKTELRNLNTFVKQTSGLSLVNKLGEIYKYNVNPLTINNPRARETVSFFANYALEALSAAPIQLPDPDKDGKGELQPGQTWKFEREARIEFQDQIFRRQPKGPENPNAPPPPPPPPRVYRFMEEFTYKYIGVRERGGVKEAVVEIVGKAKRAPGGKQEVTGAIKGTVLVELNTGVILDATIEREFEVDTSEKGIKKNASGLYRYKVTRSPSN